MLDAEGQAAPIRFRGGLLGHWACWTRAAVELHQRCQRAIGSDSTIDPTIDPAASAGEDEGELRSLLQVAHQVTDMNAAILDAANGFRGCIAGIQEVLYQQGLLASNLCLDKGETLSAGQAAEIARVRKLYPQLVDDEYVLQWLREND